MKACANRRACQAACLDVELRKSENNSGHRPQMRERSLTEPSGPTVKSWSTTMVLFVSDLDGPSS